MVLEWTRKKCPFSHQMEGYFQLSNRITYERGIDLVKLNLTGFDFLYFLVLQPLSVHVDFVMARLQCSAGLNTMFLGEKLSQVLTKLLSHLLSRHNVIMSCYIEDITWWREDMNFIFKW